MDIFKENNFSLFPIQDKELWNIYKEQVNVFWVPEEIDLSRDLEDWNNLTDQERYFIENILGFFSSSDGVVLENLLTRFSTEVKSQEVRAFYSCQAFVESIHSETYSLLIDTYIKNKDRKTELLNSIDTIPAVRLKSKWAMKWIEHDSTFGQRLIAFSIVEGLFFSGAFCSIFWLKKRGILPGLCFSNELISRDEGLHTKYAVKLYHKLPKEYKIKKNIIYEMVKEAVKIEIDFISLSLPVRLIGMNSELMIQYIKFVADRLLVQLKCEKLYNIENPFDFMEMISLRNKTNFFERRVSEYSKQEKPNFDIDDCFN